METMESLEFRHSFVIRQEETVRFQQYTGVRQGRKYILICMVVITALARLIADRIFGGLTTTQLLVSCTIGMVLGLIIPYFLLQLAIAFNISQKYQAGLSHDYEVDVLINPGGIYITDGTTDVRVYYDKMYLIRETAADFFVYPDKQTAFLIPKHQLDDVKADSKKLREMFRAFAPSDKLDLLRG
ncbi:MAG: YcxB family protein [Oscillospiraceae bacterium]